jgi:hypothetical protein
VLLSRPPLHPKVPFDLHVLGTPPAFILSQDQTLHRNCQEPFSLIRTNGFRRSLNRSSRSPPLFDCQRARHPRACPPFWQPGAPRRPVIMTGCKEADQGRPWHRPIVPRSCPRSIVGAGAFHDRVREGNGWGHPAGATRATALTVTRPHGRAQARSGRPPPPIREGAAIMRTRGRSVLASVLVWSGPILAAGRRARARG